MNIGTLTTGAAVVTTIDLTYVPQFLAYEAATQLTSIKVEVLGEDAPILDLDAVGLSCIGLAGAVGRKTNGYVFALADGLVKGKNCTITITNSAAQTPVIRAWSEGVGSRFVRTSKQKVFTDSGIEISGNAFRFLSFSNGTAASDLLSVSFVDVDGETVIQKMTLEELQIRNATDSEIYNTVSDYYLEQDGSVVEVSYIPNADTVLYLVR